MEWIGWDSPNYKIGESINILGGIYSIIDREEMGDAVKLTLINIKNDKGDLQNET
jgi:hypothetical protein